LAASLGSDDQKSASASSAAGPLATFDITFLLRFITSVLAIIVEDRVLPLLLLE
jgi:hypothetical protein